MPPDHQMWVQILLMATKSEWKKEGEEFIAKLYEPSEKFKTISPLERDVADATTRAIAKTGFDVGIRVLYLARKDKFNMLYGAGVGALFTPFGSPHFNGFKAKATGVKYPWQNYGGVRLDKIKRRMFDAYRKRGYFYDPFVREYSTFNSEEIATMWHLPGSVAATPAIDRIESKAAEPPANLPF